MAIFRQGDNSCYFIHIPRTAGRYVSALFENTSNVECKHHKINTEWISGYDITHLHYPLYEQFLGVQNIPHIAVVRNPLNKIISAVKIMHYDEPDYDHDKALSGDFFQEFMRRQLNNHSRGNNWFLPQHQFLSPKTHYWKYEWGFGKKFKRWVYDKTGIEIKPQEVTYTSISPIEVKTQKTSIYNLSRRSKKNIKEFYKKDYEHLKYDGWLFYYK
jgi:hypothetical protein